MGTKAAEETSMAVKTLHRALISPNETSSGFFSNHDVISPHEEASSEPKAWNVSDISPLSYPVFRDGGTVGACRGVGPSNFGRSNHPNPDPLLISTGFLKYPFRHSFQTGIKIQL